MSSPLVDTPPPGVSDLAWKVCESPIEKALLRGLVEAAESVGEALHIVVDLRDPNPVTGIVLVPQCKVCNHTVDFLVSLGNVSIAVECDGLRWHSRADQSRHDRAVDRALQRAGYRVYRFTGEEIWKNSRGCAETILLDLLLWAAQCMGVVQGGVDGRGGAVTASGRLLARSEGPSGAEANPGAGGGGVR